MFPIQWYTIALLGADAYELFRLWTAAPLTLASGSCWFDSSANAPLGVVLYTGLLCCLALPRFFVLVEPMNRWMLLLETIHDGLRVVLYALLYSVHKDATQLNTILISFMVFNAYIYGRVYYTTMMALRQYST